MVLIGSVNSCASQCCLERPASTPFQPHPWTTNDAATVARASAMSTPQPPAPRGGHLNVRIRRRPVRPIQMPGAGRIPSADEPEVDFHLEPHIQHPDIASDPAVRARRLKTTAETKEYVMAEVLKMRLTGKHPDEIAKAFGVTERTHGTGSGSCVRRLPTRRGTSTRIRSSARRSRPSKTSGGAP